MFTVYALYSPELKKIYIGQTENLEERLKAHRDKRFSKSYTGKLSDEWLLIYSERVKDRSEALKREKQLKSFRGREFVKKYIPSSL